MRLIDLDKVYESACAGCTRHGDAPGECYHDEPCERLIFAFTTAEPVEAVVLPCNVGSTVYETDGIRIYPQQIKKLIFDTGHIAFDESAIGTCRKEDERCLNESGSVATVETISAHQMKNIPVLSIAIAP